MILGQTQQSCKKAKKTLIVGKSSIITLPTFSPKTRETDNYQLKTDYFSQYPSPISLDDISELDVLYQ